MRIAVLGAGGVSGYFGGLLARAGHPVSMLARGAHIDALRERGLEVRTPEETFTVAVEANDDPRELGAAELAIVGALALLGKTGEIAVATALLDRLISYWSLIVIGLVVYLLWEVRGGAAESSRDLEYARRD